MPSPTGLRRTKALMASLVAGSICASPALVGAAETSAWTGAESAPLTSNPSPPRWHPNRGLLTAGGVLFGAGYLPNLVVAAPSGASFLVDVGTTVLTLGTSCLWGPEDSGCQGRHGALSLLIPVVGPILYAENTPRDSVLNTRGRPPSDLARGLLYASAGVQLTGAITALTAIALGRSTTTTSAPVARGVSVVPFVTHESLGVSLALQSW